MCSSFWVHKKRKRRERCRRREEECGEKLSETKLITLSNDSGKLTALLELDKERLECKIFSLQARATSPQTNDIYRTF